MIEICQDQGIAEPRFEEVGNYFKVALFHRANPAQISEEWEEILIKYLNEHKEVIPKRAQQLWGVTSRTTTTRLKKMNEKGLIVEVSTGPFDPHKKVCET